MDEQRVNELAQLAYEQIFTLLDSEEDIPGNVAGRIAAAVQVKVQKELKAFLEG